MRREIISIWLALTLGLAIVAYSALEQTQMPVEGQNTHTDPVGQIVGGETVGQTFLARYNHLHRIDLFMSTYARPNTHEMIFHLKATPDDDADILTLSLNADQVKDYAYHSFTFPPIPNSAGRTFYFYLESPTSIEGDAITAWMQPWDLYPQGTMFRNDTPAGGDLRFQAYYQGSYRDKVTALLDRLVENKPSIWGDKRLYILLAVMTVGGAGWLLCQTTRQLWEGEKN
jgi:hypothetical protein